MTKKSCLRRSLNWAKSGSEVAESDLKEEGGEMILCQLRLEENGSSSIGNGSSPPEARHGDRVEWTGGELAKPGEGELMTVVPSTVDEDTAMANENATGW